MTFRLNVRRAVYAAYLFLHVPVLGFSLMVPLLGAATVAPWLSNAQIAVLLAMAFAFHNFGYVLNDVVDLPLDRTQALRDQYPLVRGEVRRGHALAFALAQVPLAFVLTCALGGGLAANAALAAAFVLMAAYNLWGKRSGFPPLTDVALGLSCGLCALYGALLVSGQASRLTAVVAIFVTLFVTLMNGVHGGLRDLGNDLASGAHSTAILLGARQTAEGLLLPPALKRYMLALQTLIMAVVLAPLAAGWPGYSRGITLLVATLLLILDLVALLLGALSLALTRKRWGMIYAGTWQLVVVLTSLVVLFAFYLTPKVLACVVAAYVLPTLASGWLYTAVGQAAAGLMNRWRPRESQAVESSKMSGPPVGEEC